jgi:hypothetical protein
MLRFKSPALVWGPGLFHTPAGTLDLVVFIRKRHRKVLFWSHNSTPSSPQYPNFLALSSHIAHHIIQLSSSWAVNNRLQLTVEAVPTTMMVEWVFHRMLITIMLHTRVWRQPMFLPCIATPLLPAPHRLAAILLPRLVPCNSTL